jgi:hypothetical protein
MEDIVGIVGFFCTVIALVLGLPLVRSYVRRRELGIPRDGDVADMLHRLERIETSIETLAVEIERISEGQRFTTRLLAERAPSVPAASAALPGSDPLRQER